MRKTILLASLASLAACKGAGPESAGSVAAPVGAPGTTPHSFVNPTETKTYQSSAATQSYSYDYQEYVRYDKTPQTDAAGNPVLDDQGFPVRELDEDSRRLLGEGQASQLYQAGASTVRSPSATVTYDPRNAQFTLRIAQSGVDSNITFQDPAHRTDFNGARTPQLGVPNLETGDPSSWRDKGVQYLQVDTGSNGDIYDVSTFFYELPGTTTQYVTYAGFVRNRFEGNIETVEVDEDTYQETLISRRTKLDRAAFVFGERTENSRVPRTGTATFNGNMIASMVNNPLLDNDPSTNSYFQWLSGTARVNVDFATGNVSTALSGTTLAPLFDPRPLETPTDTSGFPFGSVAIPAGAAFTAAGNARIDLVGTGGFTGTFNSASFAFNGQTAPVDIVGSTLDGAFYGPAAQEIGASFRIVGGIPDQRVDIIGSFTGK